MQDQIELLKLRIANLEKHIAMMIPGFGGTLELEDAIDASQIVDKAKAKAEMRKSK